MTERRPHWDDDLIEAVNDAMENNAYRASHRKACTSATSDQSEVKVCHENE